MKFKFNSVQEWLVCEKKSLADFFWAFVFLLWIPAVGLISLGYHLKNAIGSFARREPWAMAIFSFIFGLMVVGWIVTFTSERTRAMNAEYERDSISIVLSRYQESLN